LKHWQMNMAAHIATMIRKRTVNSVKPSQV
jgi:hypothetical protein